VFTTATFMAPVIAFDAIVMINVVKSLNVRRVPLPIA
jgi:hypothetical protein